MVNNKSAKITQLERKNEFSLKSVIKKISPKMYITINTIFNNKNESTYYVILKRALGS